MALGYTMVYGIIRLINFAHSDFIIVGGYTMIFTVPAALALGLPVRAAVIAAIAMNLLPEKLAQTIPAIDSNPKMSNQIFSAGGISFAGITLE